MDQNYKKAFKVIAWLGLYQDRVSLISTTGGTSNTEEIIQVVFNSAEWRKMARLAADKQQVYTPTHKDINLAFSRAQLSDIWPEQDQYGPARYSARERTTKLPNHRQLGGSRDNKTFAKGLNHCAPR